MPPLCLPLAADDQRSRSYQVGTAIFVQCLAHIDNGGMTAKHFACRLRSLRGPGQRPGCGVQGCAVAPLLRSGYPRSGCGRIAPDKIAIIARRGDPRGRPSSQIIARRGDPRGRPSSKSSPVGATLVVARSVTEIETCRNIQTQPASCRKGGVKNQERLSLN